MLSELSGLLAVGLVILCELCVAMGLCLLVGVGGMVWRRQCGRIGW